MCILYLHASLPIQSFPDVETDSLAVCIRTATRSLAYPSELVLELGLGGGGDRDDSDTVDNPPTHPLETRD